jgi:protein-disulfide isomerase
MSEYCSAHLSLPVGDRDHAQGPAHAPVTLVEYGDYECPSCGRADSIVKQIQQRLGDRLRFVFRNFPLAQIHPHAQQAAEAAEIAGDQGRFWEMHDYLFAHQRALGGSRLREYAEAVGLDVEQFAQALETHRTEGRVREDFQSGVRSGVNGTPTFFINGVRHDDSYDLNVLLAALDRAAAGKGSPCEGGTGMESL